MAVIEKSMHDAALLVNKSSEKLAGNTLVSCNTLLRKFLANCMRDVQVV